MATKTLKEPGDHGGIRVTAAQKAEFDAINKKATALAKTLNSDAFDRDGNPVPGPWADMLAELDAWAGRHKITMKTTEVVSKKAGAAGEPTPRSHTACPATTHSTERIDFVGGGGITIENTCTLRRQGLFGRCIYGCIGLLVM